MPDDDISGMPPGGAENKGDSLWAQAEKLAEEHEAGLKAAGKPIPGAADASPDAETRAAEREELEKTAPIAKKADKSSSDQSNALRELEKLAEKHGFKVNGNRIEPSERVAFREEKRKWRETQQRELTQLQTRIQEESGKYAGSSAKLQALEKALSDGDLDGIAKATGFKDWRAVVDEQTKRMASPEYKRIRELEQKQAEFDERERQTAQRHKEAAEAQARNERISAYKVGMGESMKSAGGQLEKMASDPELVDFLYTVTDAHYRATGEELEVEELVETPSRMLGGKTPLDLLRSKWEALNAIFGDRPASKDEAPEGVARRSGSTSRSKEPKVPKIVSQKNAAEASPPAEFKSEAEFMRHFTELLNQSTHVSGG